MRCQHPMKCEREATRFFTGLLFLHPEALCSQCASLVQFWVGPDDVEMSEISRSEWESLVTVRGVHEG
jgi:hypothetical protein